MKIASNCIYFTPPQGGGITEYIENLVKEIFLYINYNLESIYKTFGLIFHTNYLNSPNKYL